MTPRPLSALTRRFIEGTLDNHSFGHRDHLQVAFELLGDQPFLAAAQSYTETIKRLATDAGAPEKFNMTITIAFLSLIAERMNGGAFKSFDGFLEENPDLLRKDLLSEWYAEDDLGSGLARSTFIMPRLRKRIAS